MIKPVPSRKPAAIYILVTLLPDLRPAQKDFRQIFICHGLTPADDRYALIYRPENTNDRLIFQPGNS